MPKLSKVLRIAGLLHIENETIISDLNYVYLFFVLFTGPTVTTGWLWDL